MGIYPAQSLTSHHGQAVHILSYITITLPHPDLKAAHDERQF